MTTSVILNIVFALLSVGALGAVCRTAYLVADGSFDIRPQRFVTKKREEERPRLAA
jgi:hypothetical protein